MLWAALATAIIVLSGFGDDARAIEWLLKSLSHSIELNVSEAGRRERALHAVEAIHGSFIRHRQRLQEVAECIENIDSRYNVSANDYRLCTADLGAANQNTVAELQVATSVLESQISLDEWLEISVDIAKNNQESYVDTSLKEVKQAPGQTLDERRLPGVAGVYSRRHITTPRNAVQLLSGPLAQQTFGQRFNRTDVSAGVTYQNGSAEPSAWLYRAGVGFGLYEDIEVGALFLPIELKPEVQLSDILVFFSYQFRSEHFDTALRMSLLSPDNQVLPINPGISALLHDEKHRLELAALLPIDVSRVAPNAGLHLPLRGSYNLTPHLFASLESGYAWRSFKERSHSTPLGLGVGYSLLFGKRLIDVTSLLRWDHFADWSASGGTALRASDYRFVFGLNLQSLVF